MLNDLKKDDYETINYKRPADGPGVYTGRVHEERWR